MFRYLTKPKPVVPDLRNVLLRLGAKAAKGVTGWAWGLRDLGNGVCHHNGLDLPVPTGTPVYAPWDGVVERVWDDAGGGLSVVVAHSVPLRGDANKRVSLWTGYAHLSKAEVSHGQAVQAGHVVALSGASGVCYGAHLHFTLRADLGWVCDFDPMWVCKNSLM